MDLRTNIESIKLTSGEKKTIGDAKKHLETLAAHHHQHVGKNRADRMNIVHPLTERLWSASELFASNPTEAAAAAVAEAAIKVALADHLEGAFAAILEGETARLRTELLPLTESIISRGLEALEAEASGALDTLKASPSLAAEAKGFEDRIAAQRGSANYLREEAQRDSIALLKELGAWQ